ncbi:MAG: hypothetical protein EPN89_19095 [Methylovulum sp.]|nr:MAG: hypothetical protein EPN89_19095 [Methylovulum sp.]
MKTKQILNLGLLLSAATLFSPAGFAADVMTFPGTICDASDPSQAAKITRSVAGVQNSSSTGAVTVNCPLVRDNHSNVTGTDVVHVAVYRSASATSSLQCTLSSRTSDGGAVAAHTLFFSGTGSSTLHLDVNSSSLGGYYVVSCSLPQFSAVRSIYLDEPL